MTPTAANAPALRPPAPPPARRFWIYGLQLVVITAVCVGGTAVVAALAGQFLQHQLELWHYAVVALVFTLAAAVVGVGRNGFHRLDADEARKTVLVGLFGGLLLFGAHEIFRDDFPVPITAVLIDALLVSFSLLSMYIIAAYARSAWGHRRRSGPRTIVVGAGSEARAFLRAVDEQAELPYRVVGCVDDVETSGLFESARVMGRVDDLPRLVRERRIQNVVIAVPQATPAFTKRVMRMVNEATGDSENPVSVKTLPTLPQLLAGDFRLSRVRDVKLEDLLPREPVRVDPVVIRPHLEGLTVLVTGAGGSIGSELCRQIAMHEPKLLVLLGHGENSLYNIDQELRRERGFTRTRIVLADVANACLIRKVFTDYRPHMVFHAAAHKHVPIVEANVCEAVRNNVFGTHVVALAAAASGVAKFVLLSTDKAVNPTSVMGATKRVAELICQSFEGRTATEFVAVRFGNVIGSRGSVVPTFVRQIESGQPVTVTHRDMERYFMTIPEAVSLVLHAAAIGRDGQVMALDMGQPIRIVTMAETLITLAGMVPYKDVDIVETGIRPGEKLFEEILTEQEGVTKTSHERLFIARQERIEYERLAATMARLEHLVRANERRTVARILGDLVPNFAGGPHLFEGGPGSGAAPTDVAPQTIPQPADMPEPVRQTALQTAS